MITIAHIKARRDALIAELERGKQQYAELDRVLCGMACAIGELNQLLDDADETSNGVAEENDHGV